MIILKLMKLCSALKWTCFRIKAINNVSFGKGINTGRCTKVLSYRYGKVMVGKHFHAENALNLIADEGTIYIGDGVYMNQNVSVTAKKSVEIGNNVLIGNNVVILDHDHDMNKQKEAYTVAEVVIGDNTWIGANVTILKGTVVGKNCIIGAGSVVKGVFENDSLIMGVPAKKH